MRTLAVLLLLTVSVSAQQTNNATVNIIGNNQNVTVTQSGSGHNANLTLAGDNIPVSITQSGQSPQSFNLNITCYSNCGNNPTVVNQY